MALRLEYSIDVASLPDAGLSLEVTADAAQFKSTLTSGQLTFTDISSVDSDFTPFGTALETELDADNPGAATFTVTWNGTTGFTISPSTGTMTLDFINTPAAQGTAMRRLLGFDGNQSAASSHSSNVRPYFMIIPLIQGRSQYSREKEVPAIVNEAVADDGSRVFIAKTTADKIGEWVHSAEIETTPAIFSDAGTPTHKDMVDDGTNANDVPWSWEHSFEHLRTAHHRVLVIDGSDSEVWEVRANGMFFDPSRWSGTDQPLWQVPFRGRKIGVL